MHFFITCSCGVAHLKATPYLESGCYVWIPLSGKLAVPFIIVWETGTHVWTLVSHVHAPFASPYSHDKMWTMPLHNFTVYPKQGDTWSSWDKPELNLCHVWALFMIPYVKWPQPPCIFSGIWNWATCLHGLIQVACISYHVCFNFSHLCSGLPPSILDTLKTHPD